MMSVIDGRAIAAAAAWWLVRGGGGLLMWLGIGSFLSFLPALAAHVPFFGGVAASLVGATTSVVALGGALAASAMVIAAAWLRFRPLHAAGLAAAAVAAAFGQASLLRTRQARAATQPLGPVRRSENTI